MKLDKKYFNEKAMTLFELKWIGYKEQLLHFVAEDIAKEQTQRCHDAIANLLQRTDENVNHIVVRGNSVQYVSGSLLLSTIKNSQIKMFPEPESVIMIARVYFIFRNGKQITRLFDTDEKMFEAINHEMKNPEIEGFRIEKL